MGKRNVIVSSLRRLEIYILTNLDELVINTPSLEYLELDYYNDKSHHCLIEKMPKLRQACVAAKFLYLKRLIRSITSVEFLTFCLVDHPSHGFDVYRDGFVFDQAVYGDGFVFDKLEHLELCICKEYASTVLDLCGLGNEEDFKAEDLTQNRKRPEARRLVEKRDREVTEFECFIFLVLYALSLFDETEGKKLRCFLQRNLPLHRAQALESFRLEFSHLDLEPEDIRLWVEAVVSRCVRELEISCISYPRKTDILPLPSSLYTCKSLVSLKLERTTLEDVPPMVCLPCLKNLQLIEVIYLNDEPFQRLLSICPVLEELRVMVDVYEVNGLRKIIVVVPSLLRLVLYIPDKLDEYVINTPYLKYLKLEYFNNNNSHQTHHTHQCLVEKMPKLREAYIDASFSYVERLFRSITSVNHLTLCLADILEDDVYCDGIVFNHLEHLELCICEKYASAVLVRLLKDSPNLRVLKLRRIKYNHDPDAVRLWSQPSTVPECLLSSLQTFKFSDYLPGDRDLASYFLQNARCLTTTRITS
ncbi:unnamed protein product [Microthlaspi erraticum]|uniref:Uncharacterized protein n=1 Tax=Microthlaspi erraticum TaxID=1685480 RepID=A0A6D2KEX5_9BRAS|nr:unnamed protein product [Microthlaspi erraticum]